MANLRNTGYPQALILSGENLQGMSYRCNHDSDVQDILNVAFIVTAAEENRVEHASQLCEVSFRHLPSVTTFGVRGGGGGGS